MISYHVQLAVRAILQHGHVLRDVRAGRLVMTPAASKSTQQLQREAFGVLHEELRTKIQHLDAEEAAKAADRIINETFI